MVFNLTLGKALDWSDESERNSLIYESVEPLARLYSPFVTLNDSFVLQEFFVPIDSFGLWMDAAKSTITEYGSGKNGNVTLLNLTIRFVKQDKTTFLAYSRAAGGSFAFVLYYRINRNKEADDILENIHSKLADISTSLGDLLCIYSKEHWCSYILCIFMLFTQQCKSVFCCRIM